MSQRHPERQLARPGGNHPMSIAVWTPEHNGDHGLDAAIECRDRLGGWVFASSTTPGYVAWFDSTYSPTTIFEHEVTAGHGGQLNPDIPWEQQGPMLPMSCS